MSPDAMTTATDRSTRVLVVDDEENITFLLGSALRHFGFDVLQCLQRYTEHEHQ